MRLLQQQLPARERILNDPWACNLASFAQRMIAQIPFMARRALRKYPRMDYVPARDRFTDELIEDAVRAGTRQVVVLGAGLDTISYRILRSHPDCLMYEVDHPATQAVKKQRARRLATQFGDAIRYVTADFERDNFRDKLIADGFQTQQPAVIIWMGVVYYLSDSAVRQTLARARELMTEGSTLAFDFWPPSLTEDSGDPAFKTRRRRYARLG